MYGGYMFHVRPLIREEYASGGSRVLQEQILLQFQADGVLPHERQLALDKFAFRGLYQEQDEVTTVAPDYRIGVFDTTQHGWDEETQTFVERKLLDSTENEAHILLAPATSLPPPWPRYDEYQGTVPQLLKKLVSDGYDLDDVLAYEVAVQNRPQVVEAVAALIEDPEAQSVEQVVG